MKRLIVPVFCILLVSCSSEDEVSVSVDCGDEEFSLSGDVMPVIQSNCALSGCHNGSQSPNFSSANNVINFSSRIYSKVSSGEMPPRSSGVSLSDTEKQKILCWVQNGAQDN